MRTIKFRGKRLNNGEWVYGSLTQSETHNKNGEPFMVSYIAPFIPVGSECGFELVKMDRVTPTTVGQFTGLHDKNGTPIYEGDIVEHPYIDPIFGDLVEMKDGKGVKSVVVFHEGAFCVRYGEDVFYYLDQFTRHNHIEVISNVFDNPELMKGGEQ